MVQLWHTLAIGLKLAFSFLGLLYICSCSSFLSTCYAGGHLWGCVANRATEMSCVRRTPLLGNKCMAQAAKQSWEGCRLQIWEVLSGGWKRELLGLDFSQELLLVQVKYLVLFGHQRRTTFDKRMQELKWWFRALYYNENQRFQVNFENQNSTRSW